MSQPSRILTVTCRFQVAIRDAIRLSADNPRLFKRAGADQSRDSPTGGRMGCCGSMHTTFRPALAKCSEAAFPAKPPPMTVTSQEIDGAGSDIGSLFYLNSGSVAGWCAVKRLQDLLDLPEVAAFVRGQHAQRVIYVVAEAGIYQRLNFHLIDG